MGCGDAPSSAKSSMAARSLNVVKGKAKRRRSIDFHCPTCGLTKPDYPNYRHACPGKKPVGYQVTRRSMCIACEHNRDGVCVVLKTQHPDKPALVHIGVRMPGVRCPLGKWERVVFRCDKCGSKKFNEGGLTRCPVCHLQGSMPSLANPDSRTIAIVVPANDAWLGPSRGPLFSGVLRDAGHQVDVIPVGRNRQVIVDRLSGYDLVCSHAMQISTAIVAEAARKLPDTKFVIINHSAIAHLERLGDGYVQAFAESLHLAREFPNVWYASQDPVSEGMRESTGIERCMWLPSPGVSLSPREFRGPSEPATVVIAGRTDSIKNNLVQAIACGMTRQKVRLVLCTRRTAAMAAVVEQLGVDHQWRGQLPHPQWIEFLRSEADVVLCCSLAESFGFVAAEAMQIGVPVVASDAIRFADPELRAKHTDPAAIAAKIDEALTDHEERSKVATKLGSDVMAEQQREYLARIDQFLA